MHKTKRFTIKIPEITLQTCTQTSKKTAGEIKIPNLKSFRFPSCHAMSLISVNSVYTKEESILVSSLHANNQQVPKTCNFPNQNLETNKPLYVITFSLSLVVQPHES